MGNIMFCSFISGNPPKYSQSSYVLEVLKVEKRKTLKFMLFLNITRLNCSKTNNS